MALVDGDYKWLHSTGKLGGAKTATAWQNGVKHDLFDKFTPAETLAGDEFFACVFFENGNATITMEDIALWVSSVTPSADTEVAIGLAPEGKNSAVEVIGNELTAPAGVTFTTPTTQGAGLTPVNLAPNDYIGVWVRLTINAASAAAAGDGFSISSYAAYTEQV